MASIENVALALYVPGLTPTQKLVLIGIANHSGDGGAWPSVSRLAIYACCDPRTVNRATVELEKLGWITKHINQGGTTRTPSDRRPNLYDLHLSTGVTPMSPRGMTPRSQRDDTGVSNGVTPMSPELPCNYPVIAEVHPSDNIESVDDLPEGKTKDRIAARIEAGTGHTP